MNKKNIIISVLQKLKPYRVLAEGFLFLIQETDDKRLESKLLQLIIDTLHTVQANQQQTIMIKSVKLLKKLAENEHREIDQQEAEDLLLSLE